MEFKVGKGTIKMLPLLPMTSLNWKENFGFLSKIYVHIPIWPTINKSNLIRLLIGLWHFVSIRIVKWATCRFTRPHCGCFCCSKGRCWCRSSGYNNITLTEKGNLKMSVNSTYLYIFSKSRQKVYLNTFTQYIPVIIGGVWFIFEWI